MDIDEIIDKICDGADELFGSTNVDSSDFLSEVANLSPDTLSSLLEGDFRTADLDISSMFGDVDCESVDIDSDLEVSDSLGEDISFTGNNPNKTEILFQEKRLEEANHNIEYYRKEINNFNDKTSKTYRDTCLSELQRAVNKAKDADGKLVSLKSQ